MADVINREEENLASHLVIIDNLRIEAEPNNFYDVLANPELVRNNFLNRSKQVAPGFLPQAEKTINNLTISLGSKPLEEVMSNAFSRQLNNSQSASLKASWDSTQIELMGGVFGLTIPDESNPWVYINTGQIIKFMHKEYGIDSNFYISLFRQTLDHEFFHLAAELDPAIRKSRRWLSTGELGVCIVSTGVLSLSSLPEKLVGLLNPAKFDKRISRRNFLKSSIEAAELAIITLVPSLIVAKSPVGEVINDLFFSVDEKSAEYNSSRYPTSAEEFNAMIQIKENR